MKKFFGYLFLAFGMAFALSYFQNSSVNALDGSYDDAIMGQSSHIDQDENKIDINSDTIDQTIDTLNGKHTLTVVVVDVNNRTETKVQETNGVSIPTIDIKFNDDKTAYVINLKDDVELQEVVITLDEDDSKKYGQKLSGKEFQFEIALKEGSDNKMKVQVTNSDDQTSEKAVMFKK